MVKEGTLAMAKLFNAHTAYSSAFRKFRWLQDCPSGEKFTIAFSFV